MCARLGEGDKRARLTIARMTRTTRAVSTRPGTERRQPSPAVAVSHGKNHPLIPGDTFPMRPTVFLTSSAAAALAASAVVTPSAAQDAPARRDREAVVERLRGLDANIYRLADDRDRAVLGVSLGASRSRSDTLGVRISDVTEGGPAAKAGIEEGDRITSIDGTNLRIDAADAEDPALSDLGYRRLQRALGKHKPGDEVTLTVARGRETRTVRVKTVAADELTTTRGYAFGPDGGFVLRGGSAREMSDSIRARSERRPALGVTVGATGSRRDTLGLFVSNVAEDGPAERAGIVEGARIASIGGVDVRVSKDDLEDPEIASIRSRRFTRELEKHKPGDDLALRVWQNGAYRTVTVKAARAADVYKGRSGFAFSFGDGDGVFTMPPMPAIAPMAPMSPMPPMAPMTVSPRAWMLSTPRPLGTTRIQAVPRATYVTPRAVTIPGVRRRLVEM